MKCSHPMCNRGIGLVSHRRAFSKSLYCSRRCRDNYAGGQSRRSAPASSDARLFAWLFAAPADARPGLVPVPVRARARSTG